MMIFGVPMSRKKGMKRGCDQDSEITGGDRKRMKTRATAGSSSSGGGTGGGTGGSDGGGMRRKRQHH